MNMKETEVKIEGPDLSPRIEFKNNTPEYLYSGDISNLVHDFIEKNSIPTPRRLHYYKDNTLAHLTGSDEDKDYYHLCISLIEGGYETNPIFGKSTPRMPGSYQTTTYYVGGVYEGNDIQLSAEVTTTISGGFPREISLGSRRLDKNENFWFIKPVPTIN